MRQYLDLLINLQGVDIKIGVNNNQIANIKNETSAVDQAWQKSKQGLEQLKTSHEDANLQRRKHERDLEIKEAEIKKYQGQVLSVKTNREYNSLLHEIDTVKAEGGKLEEEVIKMMELNDNLQQQIMDHQKKLDEEQKQVEQQKQSLQTQLNKNQQEMQNLQQQREQVKQGVEKRLLVNYEKLLKGKGGIAITLVKDGVCQGCFIHITPQTYEEIKKRDKIFNCPNCHRMLYTENNSQASLD